MNLTSQLFFMELITTMAGCATLFLWWIFRELFLKVNPKMVFLTVNWVLLLCIVPIGYCFIQLNLVKSYIRENVTVNLNFRLTQGLSQGLQIILICWGLLGIWQLIRYTRQIVTDVQICRSNVPEDKQDVLELFEELKDRLGISEKVVLEQNDSIRIPRAMGVIHPRVVLPYTEESYDRRELEMILSHELLHIKSHDVWYKIVTAFIVGTQCFNPLIFLLFRSINLLCENRCDAKVRELMSSDFTTRDYFDTLLRMNDSGEDAKESFLSSMLVKRSSLERRVIFMKKYSTKRKASKVITAALTLLFMVSSTLSAYAASVGASELHDELYKTTEPLVQIFDEEGNELVAHYISAEDAEDTNIIYMDMNTNPMARMAGTFNWTIPGNVRSVTPTMGLASGTEISVSTTVRPTTSTFWMGVMLDKDGSGWYYEAKKDASYTFKINAGGVYRVFVENRSSVEVTASGSFNYD